MERRIPAWSVSAALAFCNDRAKAHWGQPSLEWIRLSTSHGFMPRFVALDTSRFA